MSTPLATKLPEAATPTLEPEPINEAAVEPEAPAKQLAVGGLSKAAKAPVPVVGLTAQERRKKVETLTEADKLDVAAEWGLDAESVNFKAVMRSDLRYQFFLLLSGDERQFITEKQITKRQKPNAAFVLAEARKKRLQKQETVLVSDYADLETEWGVNRASPQFKAAMKNDLSFQMFRKVPRELRKIVSGGRIKKGTLLTKEEVADARLKKAAIAAEEAEAQRQAESLVRDKTKLAASKAAFETKATAQRKRIAERVRLEIPDFVWEEDFDASVGTGRARVATGALATKQDKQLGDRWDSAINEATKKRDVDAAVAEFATLFAGKLDEIKTDVLADESQSCDDFRSRAAAALSEQRNPAEISTWIRWLELTMYPRYKQLTERSGLPVHFTVAANSISLPARVTKATTAAQLLNSLFRAPSGKKMDEAHVSLETGITDLSGSPKHPHKYWLDGATEYELYFNNSVDQRWADGWAVGDIKTALDDAMAEIHASLLARATYVLSQDGRL